MQTAYKGWPLYFYYLDMKEGDVFGQGVRDVWFVINPTEFPPVETEVSNLYPLNFFLPETVHSAGNRRSDLPRGTILPLMCPSFISSSATLGADMPGKGGATGTDEKPITFLYDGPVRCARRPEHPHPSPWPSSLRRLCQRSGRPCAPALS